MSQQGYHLLVVDDTEANRDMLSRRLVRQGYEVETAENGEQALEILRADPDKFDLILLDIMMPGMPGYEVLEAIKKDPSLKHIPVIMISALTEMDSVVKCIELGAEDYLNKPIDPILLQARLRPTLDRKRLRDVERAYLQQIEAEKQRADQLLHVVIPMGIGLTAERDFNQLLDMVIIEAMKLAHADGGTLYLCTGPELAFEIMHNESLGIAMGGSSKQPITLPPLPLYTEDGTPNERNIATYAALHREVVNIPDAYTSDLFDFSGTRKFDERMGYRTTSVLAIPLRNPKDEIVGVLQLINARDPRTDAIIGFDRHVRELSESLAQLACAALEASMRETQLRQQIEQLKIVIDEQHKLRQVEEITDTEYFRDLQGKAQDIRRRRHDTEH